MSRQETQGYWIPVGDWNQRGRISRKREIDFSTDQKNINEPIQIRICFTAKNS